MQLIEQTSWAAESIDEENGVIKGVKILGVESKNNRRYPSKVLQEALPKYEGLGVNLDHQRGNRRVSDGFGRLRAVQLREDGIYGDLEYLRSHPFANQFIEAARRMPEQVGLSQSAEGRVSQANGTAEVESIDLVKSVDVVRYPATTKGLFESSDEQTWTVNTVVIKQVDEGSDPASEEPPTEPTPSDPPADTQAEGDPPPEPDPPAEQPPAEEPPAEQEPPAEEEPPAAETPTVESLQRDLADLRHRLDISEALLAGNVDRSQLTDDQASRLHSLTSREQIEAFVESLPQMTRRQPRSIPQDAPTTYSALREEFISHRRRSRLSRAV
jgi:outer membrane biosynthesis protein TonB